jgi:hypothetical protein
MKGKYREFYEPQGLEALVIKFLKRTFHTIFLVFSVPLILIVSLVTIGWDRIKTKLRK